jgi:hypothetical protein
VSVLLNRISIPAAERLLQLKTGGIVSIKSLQPIVWISVTPPQVIDLPDNSPRFPAVIDTGFNQTLLIQDQHLKEWGGVNPGDLQLFPGETARYGSQTWPFRIADIWLHAIESDNAAVRPIRESYCLETHPGILVVSKSERWQRLPVLGMRALAWNRIKLHLEFESAAMGWLTMETS